jgi:hypothetical protein
MISLLDFVIFVLFILFLILLTKENYSLPFPKLTTLFNSNIKVSIFAIHTHKVLIFFIFDQYYFKIPILSLFFIKNKEKNLEGVKIGKWPKGWLQPPHFFFKKKKIFIKIRGNMGSFGYNWSNCKN